MVYVCPCRYPVLVIDKRDDEDDEVLSGNDEEDQEDHITYIAVPEGMTNLPLDIYIKDDFVIVKWRDIKSSDHIKEYETNEHIVIAGCSSPVEMKNGQLKCDDKDIYMVSHPVADWLDDHIRDIR